MSPEEERVAFERRQLRHNPAADAGQRSRSDMGVMTSSDSHQEGTEPAHNGRTFYRTVPRSADLHTKPNRSPQKSLTNLCSINTATSTPDVNMPLHMPVPLIYLNSVTEAFSPL